MPLPSSSSSSSSSHALILRQNPIRTLLLSFAAWKSLLLLVALCSPGQDYDTSTSLVLTHAHAHPQYLQHLQPGHEFPSTDITPLPTPLHYIATKLTRWDAIYFTQTAARGYRFEQEWAFGWGLTRLIALVTDCMHHTLLYHIPFL